VAAGEKVVQVRAPVGRRWEYEVRRENLPERATLRVSRLVVLKRDRLEDQKVGDAIALGALCWTPSGDQRGEGLGGKAVQVQDGTP